MAGREGGQRKQRLSTLCEPSTYRTVRHARPQKDHATKNLLSRARVYTVRIRRVLESPPLEEMMLAQKVRKNEDRHHTDYSLFTPYFAYSYSKNFTVGA